MKIHLKRFALVVFVLVLVVTLILLANPIFDASKVTTLNPQYLSFRGTVTKIYLVAADASYGVVNETINTNDGQTIQKGTMVYAISVVLRNDYTIYEPPPPNGVPISPVDATAYIYFNVQVYSEDNVSNASVASVRDFSIPLAVGTGLVLVSGQISSETFYLATQQKDINRFEINLLYVGDSIPI